MINLMKWIKCEIKYINDILKRIPQEFYDKTRTTINPLHKLGKKEIKDDYTSKITTLYYIRESLNNKDLSNLEYPKNSYINYK